jgi:hypothetical protein
MKTEEEDSYFNIETLKRVINSIRQETRPIKGHTDPAAIQDCWNTVNDIIELVYSKSEVKRIAFRAAELTAMKLKNGYAGIAHLDIDYDQIIENKGLVVGKPKDH